jgi:hypothetical protein
LLWKVVDVLNSELLLPKFAVVLSTLLFGLDNVVAAVVMVASNCPISILDVMAEHIGLQPLCYTSSIAFPVEVGHLD